MTRDLRQLELDGVALGVETAGAGRDILYLSSGMWFGDDAPFIDRLARHGRVITPIAPGFGPGDPGARMTTIDDIAYLYLDLIDAMTAQQRRFRLRVA